MMGESIFKQTGWFVTFLVGGPEPRQNGKIMTFMEGYALTVVLGSH